MTTRLYNVDSNNPRHSPSTRLAMQRKISREAAEAATEWANIETARAIDGAFADRTARDPCLGAATV